MRDHLEGELETLLERVLDYTNTQAKRYTPVDTGRARDGWRTKREGSQGTVENPVPYVQYLEKPFAKSKQAPRGIIGPTLTAVKGKFR